MFAFDDDDRIDFFTGDCLEDLQEADHARDHASVPVWECPLCVDDEARDLYVCCVAAGVPLSQAQFLALSALSREMVADALG